MAQQKKVALVTGADKGIGLETVRQLAAKGYHVLLGSRDPAKGEAAAKSVGSPDVEAIQLDLTKDESIATAAKTIERQHERLDVLVNNAGIMLDDDDKQPSEQSLDTWRTTFDTNVFGTVAVTKALLPLLKKSEGARIVNQSSLLGSNAEHQDPKSSIYTTKRPAYDVSKSALNAWTVHLAHELKDTPHKVNCCHPGHVQTEMGGPEAPMPLPEGAETGVWLATLPADGPTGGYFHKRDRLRW